MSAAGAWWRDVVGLVLPRGCAGCDLPDEVLCPSCAGMFHGTVVVGTAAGLPCRVYACAVYEGVVRHAVLSWKDHGDEECDRPFARLLREPLRRALGDCGYGSCGDAGRGGAGDDGDGGGAGGDGDGGGVVAGGPYRPLLVPAPSSRASLRRRGRRHLDPLVRSLSRSVDRPDVRPQVMRALEYRRAGVLSGRKSVETAGATDRAARVEGRIRVRPGAMVRGRDVIVVDDIITTGATMRACMTALERAGAHVSAGLVLAATPRYGISAG
ncbi:ComF family protein [Bifidobacterium saguinibicoloris]|uniref:ComF family protein n=1 Tax=Bifidobacterium saguinibicoloris TaxID=2834433 RepID=UPI001C58F52D|nr:phosphoribosyltransferase family protein [Bifidobacterium saguinibicoloris]MBW3080351.1 ComF family protein [Bifidobacterium saguinibicoloris]